MSNLGNKYYVIYWEFGVWNKAYPYGKSLADAEAFEKEMCSDKQCDIIHEMWLDSLGEWPEPGYFDED